MYEKILVVDDEAEIVELIWMILAGDGLDILTAHGGLEALKIVRAERPQLVRTDIMMPRMSGLELPPCCGRTPRRATPWYCG
ncbi:MAG: response regulator [Chloroflexota bacterium]|nr:response regulator [Chloroflexota bacterium]